MSKIIKYLSQFLVVNIFCILLQLISNYLSLFYKAQAFEEVTNKVSNTSLMISSLGLLILFHFFSVFFRLTIEILVSTYSQIISKKKWDDFFPRHITKDKINSNSSFFNSLIGLNPRLYKLKRKSSVSFVHALVSYSIYLIMIFKHEFWEGLIFLVVSLFSSFFSGKILQKNINLQSKELEMNRSGLMLWLEQYFSGALPRQLGWISIRKSRKWYSSKGKEFFQNMLNYEHISYLKNLLTHIFVELPYFIFIGGILIFSLKNGLGISGVIIWLGLAEYVISANTSLASFYRMKEEIKNLEDIIDKNLSWVDDSSNFVSMIKQKVTSSKSGWFFDLKDTEKVYLPNEKGIFKISGKNGSGKSSLLHSIVGFSQESFSWDSEEIGSIRSNFYTKVRFLNSDVVIYEDLSTLYEQIIGPSQDVLDCIEVLKNKLNLLLGHELSKSWIQKINMIENKVSDAYVYSSGEKSIIGFLRMVYSVDEDTRLIISDESDLYYDQDTQLLWSKSLKMLSDHFTIYYINHMRKKTSSTIVQDGHFLAYSNTEGKGKVVDFHITATSFGSRKCEGIGNVGKALEGELNQCVGALIHSNRKYNLLNKFDFQIYSEFASSKIGNVTSATLAIAVCLENIINTISNKKTVKFVAATGRVLPDGSVDEVSNLNLKVLAAKENKFIKSVLTPKDIDHLKNLSSVLHESF